MRRVDSSIPTPRPSSAAISPLLLNIALHGMEDALGIRWSTGAKGERRNRTPRALVRYADDFIVFCPTKDDAEQARRQLGRWLADRGLTLSEDKTRLVHLSEGFNFLGFHVRHYHVPAHAKTGYKLLITPSSQATRRVRERLRAEWDHLRGANAGRVIGTLTPIIRGWVNYHRTVSASHAFNDLDNWMFHRERQWMTHAHPTKSWAWKARRYFGQRNPTRADHWVFGVERSGAHLPKFAWFPIIRHVMVRGTASPDDPSLREYWERRNRTGATRLNCGERKIARRQGYRCQVCRESLFNGEELHKHHLIPRSQGGSEAYTNLAFCHLYCHQQLHSKRTRDA